MTMRVGTGKASLAFADGVGLFGFGPGGGRGMTVPAGSDDADTLEARALYIERGDRKLLVVSFDVASGSRVVHRAILEALAKDGIRLDPGQLWVAGTHTHSGPGHSFGNLYDVVGQWPPFYRGDVVGELVLKGLAAARQALRAPVACRAGVVQHELWGPGRNRSLRAFLANFEDGDPTAWPVDIGFTAPADLTPEERAIDPRLTVVAFIGADQRPLATWATWCCHPASIHRAPLRAFHRDWPGVAVDRLEKTVPFAMIHQGANGDVTSLPSGLRRIADPMARVRSLGETIGAAWERAFEEAAGRADEIPFELGYRSFVPRKESLPTFEIGWSVIAGSEEFDPGWLTKAMGESMRFPWRGAPQAPKLPAVGPLQWLLRLHPALRPSPEHPLGLLRLGHHLFFASPFEQTTVAGRLSEREIIATWKTVRKEDVTASPIGLVGDYAGYLAAQGEYAIQHYEGGHTLYGSEQRAALGRAWSSLVTAGPLVASAPAYQEREPTFTMRVRNALDAIG